MTDVIDELAEDNTTVDQAHVKRRVQDWLRRVSQLYDDIERWLPDGYHSDRGQSVTMDEMLMQRHHVRPVQLPILTINKKTGWVGKAVPKGLWIIGANGRVDLFVGRALFLIVDRSQNFEPSKWFIAPSMERREQSLLDKNSFNEALLS